MDEYAYIEINNVSGSVTSICFDVIPVYDGRVPEYDLIQNKYFYHKMESSVVSYKLNGGITDTYYVVEIIDNPSLNIEYIIETYKQIPTYEEDITVYSDVDNSGKKIFTIERTGSDASKNGFLISAKLSDNQIKNKRNSDDLYFVIKCSTYPEKPKSFNFSELH